MKLKEVAAIFCKENNIDISELTAPNNRKNISTLRKNLAIKLNSFGGHPDDIAKILNRDRTTVLYYLKGHNVQKGKYSDKGLVKKAIKRKNELLKKIAVLDEFIRNYEK